MALRDTNHNANLKLGQYHKKFAKTTKELIIPLLWVQTQHLYVVVSTIINSTFPDHNP